ncbi:MAG: hypothetical protein DI565_19625 [Ancylobacter novellus]|uniref:Transposase IS204/IS1001/IS1096/IS1165 zinc-finger domain-containing protein n=1 Tax=Ancylobacter novellus TaxID=921 RepID=A0A2W5K4G2_ANCNO|nr:MAG: hypothetical protein DI565_19625 [Ancylobacter novellus]
MFRASRNRGSRSRSRRKHRHDHLLPSERVGARWAHRRSGEGRGERHKGLRSKAADARCPLCYSPAQRIHSRYVPTVPDLPFAGRPVRLRLTARRFVCEQASCPRRIFGEPFAGFLGHRARRAERLETVVHHLGLALGGRPGAGLARRLMLPVTTTRCCGAYGDGR